MSTAYAHGKSFGYAIHAGVRTAGKHGGGTGIAENLKQIRSAHDNHVDE